VYKYTGFGLIGLIVVLLLPAGIDGQPNGIHMYGTTTIEQYDSHGNQIFSQTVHNLITDDGEDYIIEQLFRDTENGETSDGFQIGAICITDNTDGFGESQSATGTDGDFDNDNGIDESFDNCIEDDGVVESDESILDGVKVIGPLTFIAGTHLAEGDTIAGIGICQGNQGLDGQSFQGCNGGASGGGILFATINTGDVTLNGGDTAAISYTFDIGEGEESVGSEPPP